MPTVSLRYAAARSNFQVAEFMVPLTSTFQILPVQMGRYFLPVIRSHLPMYIDAGLLKIVVSTVPVTCYRQCN
jgi:hypothetical protein